ncbi:MAG: hypothetical protein JO348_10850 [Alphaproteobacteria bacterium]|nr:hypothetical protein [Alphaproteobacteria bacterium]
MSQSLSPARNSFAPTTARGPRVGLAGALLLHAAIVASTLFSWHHSLEIADESPPVVPVDLVTLGDKTNITPTVDRRIKPIPKEEDVKPPEETPPTPTPAPPPQAEVAPEPTPSPVKNKPEPAPKPTTKPQPPAPTKPDKPKPVTDDFSALLNKLTAPTATPRNAKPADRTIRGVGAMNAMTMDLIDSLRNQVAQCWSPPVGAPHPEQLRPQFRVFLNQDGTVARPPQFTGESSGDPFMRAAIEAARRAIMTCQPYKLPPDKYNTWRDITLDFDPSKMVQ